MTKMYKIVKSKNSAGLVEQGAHPQLFWELDLLRSFSCALNCSLIKRLIRWCSRSRWISDLARILFCLSLSKLYSSTSRPWLQGSIWKLTSYELSYDGEYSFFSNWFVGIFFWQKRQVLYGLFFNLCLMILSQFLHKPNVWDKLQSGQFLQEPL